MLCLEKQIAHVAHAFLTGGYFQQGVASLSLVRACVGDICCFSHFPETMRDFGMWARARRGEAGGVAMTSFSRTSGMYLLNLQPNGPYLHYTSSATNKH